jgi:endo-1,4-beta-D-glucanase Y
MLTRLLNNSDLFLRSCSNIDHIDNISKSGAYLTNIDTFISEVSSTDTLISNCTSLKLLCISPTHPNAGSLYSFVDGYGSTITPTVGNVEHNIYDNGFINVSINLLGNSNEGQYPFAGIGFDFADNGDNPTEYKIEFDISSYTGVSFTYKSSADVKVKLMDKLSSDGSSWYAMLPMAINETTITLPWSSFAQPTWISGSQIRAIPTDKIIGINIQYETEQTAITFELHEISMVGTGPFIQSGLDISNDELVLNTKLKIIQWFERFYVENGDKSRARIMWLDQNHTDELITVSESIGYAMLLCVSMNTTEYMNKFDRLWAFYVQNQNSNGLMDWKVSGWNNVVIESGAATDADLNVAMALMLAYEKWHEDKYLSNAKYLLDKIFTYETFTDTNGKLILKPGDEWNDYQNPSYINLAAIYMAKLYDTTYNSETEIYVPNHDWDTVYEDNLWLLQQNQTIHNVHGLPSNWCTSTGTPVAGNTELGYGYDASRVIKHLSMAYLMNWDTRLLDYMSVIANDSDIISRSTSDTSISDMSLTITSNTWGSDNNSIGLLSIIHCFIATSNLTEYELNSMISKVLDFDDDNDYYMGVLKCMNLIVVAKLINRQVTNYTDTIKKGYVLSFGGNNDLVQEIQIAFDYEYGTIKFRRSNSDWSYIGVTG